MQHSTLLGRDLYGRELRLLLLPLRRWWWLLLFVPPLCGSIAYVATIYSTKYYQARATIRIGPPQKETIRIISDNVVIRLGTTYRQIMQESGFLDEVAQQVNNSLSPDEIGYATVIHFTFRTGSLEVQIVDSDSERVVLVLDAIRDALISSSPQAGEVRRKIRQSFVAARQRELSQLISARQQEIVSLNGQMLGNGDTTGKNSTLQFALAGLQQEIDGYTTEYQELAGFAKDEAANQLSTLEEPHIIASALGPQAPAAFAVATVASLALLILACFVFDKLDGRIYHRSHVEAIFGQHILLDERRGANKSVPQQYSLVAAELIANSFNYSQTRTRLLVIPEHDTYDVPDVLEHVRMALAMLGATVVVRDDVSDRSAANLLTDWELVVQGNDFILPLRAQEWTEVLVLCSLNASRSSSLRHIATALHETCNTNVNVILTRKAGRRPLRNSRDV